MRVRRGLNRPTAKFLAVLAGAALSAEMSAHAQTAQPSVEDLQKQLRQRDALIQSLVRRVEKLERQMGAGRAAPAGPSAPVTRAVARSRAGSPPATATEVALHPDEAAPMTAQAAPAAEPTPPAAPTQPPTAKPPAPGQFEVSEEAAERALERTLVATGNLVLPEGFAEVQPVFAYSRAESPALVLFNVNQNQLTPVLGFRVGLPWESQVDMSLPWNFVEQKQIDIAVSPSQLVSGSGRWGNSIGDLTVGTTKTFLHESGWVPSLLGRVSYEIPTGPLFAHRTPLPSGRSQLSFSLTGLKRQDPLVFVATGGYTKAFESNGIKPGDSTSFTLGAFLATSPETTLRGVLSQTFSQDFTINGVTLPGSNSVQSLLTFGASSILGRGILVDLQAGIGLTSTTPKYQVVLSGTYRFPVTGQ
jgi:hypothetical protein